MARPSTAALSKLCRTLGRTLCARLCGTLCSLLAAAMPLRGQDTVWRLPPLGAAEYRREWRATASEVARTGAAARSLPATAKVPDRYLHRLAPAPWVCD